MIGQLKCKQCSLLEIADLLSVTRKRKLSSGMTVGQALAELSNLVARTATGLTAACASLGLVPSKLRRLEDILDAHVRVGAEALSDEEVDAQLDYASMATAAALLESTAKLGRVLTCSFIELVRHNLSLENAIVGLFKKLELVEANIATAQSETQLQEDNQKSPASLRPGISKRTFQNRCKGKQLRELLRQRKAIKKRIQGKMDRLGIRFLEQLRHDSNVLRSFDVLCRSLDVSTTASGVGFGMYFATLQAFLARLKRLRTPEQQRAYVRFIYSEVVKPGSLMEVFSQKQNAQGKLQNE